MENPIAFTVVVLSMFLAFFVSWYSRRWTRTTAEFYVAGGKIPWRINAMAMLGDYCSAASFLGVAGAIALGGIDSWWLAVGFFAAWIVVLLVLAGPLKNAGKFTVGDLLSARFDGKTVRILAMLATVILCTLYLVPQMVGAGHLFQLLLGWDYITTVLVTGSLMGAYVVLGGMRGTTYNQAIQGVMLMGAMLLVLVLVTALHFGGNPIKILAAAREAVPPSVAVGAASQVLQASPPEAGPASASGAIAAVKQLMPEAPSAITPGVGLKDVWNQMSLVLGLFFGVVGLPHILIRFYTVRDARAARKSAEATIIGLAVFYIAVMLVGLGGMLVLYPTLLEMLAAGKTGAATNLTVPLLGSLMGGQVLLGVIVAGALAAMLSTSAGLLISATTSLAHDLYAGVVKPSSTDRERLIFAKTCAGILAVIAIILAVYLKNQNVAVLVGMAFGIAASTFAPALTAAVWWKRLTREGLIAGLSVGLVVSLLYTFAKYAGMASVLGLPVLINPALYSLPAATGAMILASYLTSDRGKVAEFMATAHSR
ncbi:MAG: cation acetate symporter [Desulforudis sp.]|jgi:cation/acetate symporter|nr:cation acetate symporter [Clostridia bacterium]RJX16720.1 MAG: cation acetate symporter [Desulforudis sp.]